ncbi:MAG: class F sortase [bacterium]|nr:class F sortase [bacterium]
MSEYRTLTPLILAAAVLVIILNFLSPWEVTRLSSSQDVPIETLPTASTTATPSLTAVPSSTMTPIPTPTLTPTAIPTSTETQTPTSTPSPTPTPPSGIYLEISKLGVSSQTTPRDLIVETAEATETPPALIMPSPQEADEIVIYSSGFAQTQVVLAGHLEYGGSTAIFERLAELVKWDEITLWRDGVQETYLVLTNETYPLDSLNVASVVGRSSWFEAMTLITCAGTYQDEIKTYDQRRVVQAVRIK